MEVDRCRKIQYEALLPALIASYTAAYTSHTLGLEKFYVLLKDTLEISDAGMAVRLIVLGIIFGLTGRLFSFLLAKSKKFFGEKIKNPYFRIGVISIPLALILFLLYNGRYSGLGTNLISAAFSGGMIYSYDWILKLLLTILTLAIGYQGGEVTPLFSIGCIAWNCFRGNSFHFAGSLCGTRIRSCICRCNEHTACAGVDRT